MMTKDTNAAGKKVTGMHTANMDQKGTKTLVPKPLKNQIEKKQQIVQQ